jgi:hypothetical protein
MERTWYPQRNENDFLSALFKNFIHYLKYPISKSTIEKDVREHADYPDKISLKTIMELLIKWEVEHQAFKCSAEKIKDIKEPSIVLINNGLERNFVLFFSIKNGIVEYLDTRRGWVLEDQEKFNKQFVGIALTATSLKSKGETDFDKKEAEYEEKRLSNPELKHIRMVDDFLTDEECEYIINLATPLFERSMFLYGDKRVLDDRRTSYSAELHVFPDDKILNGITKRASELLNIPVNHFEYFQCLSYDKNQEIDHHYDTFDANSEGGKKIIEQGGQRKYTMLAYLNDDFEGGGTFFPDLNFLVTPKKRSVLIFNNLDENGQILKHAAWHGGLPVTSGRKLAMNMWVRNKPCR